MEFAQTNKKTKFYFNDMEKGVKAMLPDGKYQGDKEGGDRAGE